MKDNKQSKQFLLVASAAMLVSPLQTMAKKQPNFVIIVADDMGYGDVQIYGNKYIKTPNIDMMARKGMLFPDFHSNGSVSSPTRCALMTGRYQQRAGLENVILVPKDMDAYEIGLQPKEVTFADVLGKNGYKTALIGKWHLGYKEKYNPLNHGFQKFIGFKSGNVDYQSHRNRYGDLDWWDGLESHNMPGYTTSLLTSLSKDYIKENKDKPFCLCITHAAPHSPLQGPSDAAIRDGHKTGDVAPGRSKKEIYKDMVEELDKGVGEVLQTIKECGIEENTFVIFFSDNGPVTNYGGSSGDFRGEKGQIWEGGHRVPGICYMPGTIKEGSICKQPVMGFDVFPTMLDMANIKYDDSKRKLDGVSLLPLLIGKEISPRPLFWEIGKGNAAVRDDKWKLVREKNEDGGAEIYYLFDLEKDPSEKVNLCKSEKEIVKEMNEKLIQWEKSVYSDTPDQFPKRKNQSKTSKINFE